MGGVKDMATGGLNSFILMNDGTLWTRGYNGAGQLGDGTKTNQHILTRLVPPE